MAYQRLPLPTGFVEYVVDGPDDGRDLLIFHVGTPNAAVHWDGLIAAAAQAGMRVASYSRGGYGTSPRQEGRSIADEAAITAALADRLGFERFYVLGTSGGGPPALAGAAFLGDRVLACGILAGLAPRVEVGPAWEAFVPEAQLPEWNALAAGDTEVLLDDFRQAEAMFGRITAKGLATIGGPPDARAVRFDHRRQFIPALIRSMRRAFTHGFYGALDDNLAQAREWGFRAADIRRPVVVRHGALDRLVSIEQGRWLAANIPGARGTFLDDAGHGSICLPWSEVVQELVAAGN